MLMFLAKVDIAALVLHSVSAGMTGLILVAGVVSGDWSALSSLLSSVLFLVNSGAVLRVLRKGERRRHPREEASTRMDHAARQPGRSLNGNAARQREERRQRG
jgi:hypothetical protein